MGKKPWAGAFHIWGEFNYRTAEVADKAEIADFLIGGLNFWFNFDISGKDSFQRDHFFSEFSDSSLAPKQKCTQNGGGASRQNCFG